MLCITFQTNDLTDNENIWTKQSFMDAQRSIITSQEHNDVKTFYTKGKCKLTRVCQKTSRLVKYRVANQTQIKLLTFLLPVIVIT